MYEGFRFFIFFFLPSHHPNQCLENIFFLFAPLQLSLKKKPNLRLPRYWRGISPRVEPQSYACMFSYTATEYIL